MPALSRSPVIPPALLWLTGGLALAILPHSMHIPAWMTGLFAGLALWRVYQERPGYRRAARSSLPARFSRQLILFVIVAGVLSSYGTLLGRDAGVALLVLLAGMKLLESGGARDYYIGGFIAMFLILTNFFYAQTILSAVHMVLVVICIITALISLNDARGCLDTQGRLRLAAALLLQSVPLLLILFVLFPRVDGPLWGLPKDAHAGTSGLDDEMAPGQISQLSLSNAVAFRVEFFGPMPEQSALYWRGPVLWYNDGVKWVGDKARRKPPPVSVTGSPVHYAVTLEATDHTWLYALEMPAAPPQQAIFSHDLQILARTPVHARRRYELRSYTHFKIPARDQAELERALQLPQGYHPQAIKLGKSWRHSGLNSREIVATALQMFHREAFYYTLHPPLLLQDNVDEFLFESRQGFCEHYAAAFVVLMRAAGVPARVITGYQGGALNPVGHYLVVRQHDAHAWAEVWLGEDGWVRVDPTAAVSPARIREGIENALPGSVIDIPLGLQNNKLARDIWNRIRYRLDAINNRWNQWVLGYNHERQHRFLQQLGFNNIDWRGMAGWLLALLALIMAGIALFLFKPDRVQADEAKRLYDMFCRKLARCGIARQAYEGPRDFAARAGHRRRDLGRHINKITSLYIAIRYRENRHLLPVLRRQLKRFRPAGNRGW